MKHKIFSSFVISLLCILFPLSVFADDIEKEKTAYEEAQFESEAIREELLQAKNSYEYAQQHPDEEGMQDILAAYPEMLEQTEKKLAKAEDALAQTKANYDMAKEAAKETKNENSSEILNEISSEAPNENKPAISSDDAQKAEDTQVQSETQKAVTTEQSNFYLDLLAAVIIALILIGIRMYVVKKFSEQ